MGRRVDRGVGSRKFSVLVPIVSVSIEFSWSPCLVPTLFVDTPVATDFLSGACESSGFG